MSEKICICDPVQSNIKQNEALDIIRPDGRIAARFHKDCEIHGYKRLDNRENDFADTNSQK